MAGSDRQYYDEDKARNLVEGMVGGFENQVKQVYGNILDTYVMSTDKIVRIHTQAK